MPRFFSRNYNSSLKFNGSSNYVTLGTSGSIAEASSAFTVIAWFKQTAPAAGSVVTIVADTDVANKRFYFQLLDGKIRSYVATNGTSANFAGNLTYGFGVWNQVALTYDGSNARSYINGVLDQTVTCTGVCSASTAGMAIGRGLATARYMPGNIARVQYWNARALSLAEIQEIYFNGADESSASIRSGMTGEWKLDEGTGSTAIDTFGSNNGTITGATYDSDVPFESKFIQRNANAAILANGADGAAGNILSVPFSATLNPTAAVTLEIWFRPTALKAGILFDNSTVGTTNSYFLSMGADGSMNWFSTIGGLSKTIVGTAKKAKFFEWNCVSATYNGSAVLIFLNGSQLAETLAVSGALGTNSGPLRIGAYYSGGISATFLGNLSQPRVYAAGCTLAEHQDRYYRSITSTALQAGLVLDLNTQLGAGSTVTDLSGLGNHATMGASASWTSDSPFKSRKASVNANMVKNGNFEYAPPFTAATTGSGVWVDGTTAGSATNDLFNWYKINGVSTFVASFDSAVKNSGTYSMKIEATNTTGRGRVMNTPFEATTTEALVKQYGIPVQRGLDYRLTAYVKTNNVPASSVKIAVQFFTALGVAISSTNSAFFPATQDFTIYTAVITAPTTADFARIAFSQDVAGTVCQAWIDDLTFLPVYPEGRVPANGNLVKNFDFEVVPTFVAATTGLGRWIDGSSAGSTTNATYKWGTNSANSSGTIAAQFDSSTSNSGSGSMKVSTTATASTAVVSNALTNTLAAVSAFSYRVNPGISYTYSVWMRTNYVSGDSDDGAYVQFTERNAAAGSITSTTSTKVKTTTGWTNYTGTITTNAATVYLDILFFVRGTTGTGTLIMDAWFDDIYLAPTTNPGRVAIT